MALQTGIQLLKLQTLVNHIAFVLDKSSSMSGRISKLEEVFDKEITHLKQRSQELKQETRISIYAFNGNIECLVSDMDVMRMPSLKGTIKSEGNTALLYATKVAIDDLNLLPQKYGDHAFLVYVLTDGEENASSVHKVYPDQFKQLLLGLPENFTVAALVPTIRAMNEAKQFGFIANNIQIWDTTSEEGIETVGMQTKSAINTYMLNRAAGIRGSNTMFSNLSNVSTTDVKKALTELDPKLFTIYSVRRTKDAVIQPFVEMWTKQPYRLGSAYYELCKTEREVQASKNICIQDRKKGHVYEGDSARDLLALPKHTVRLKPGDHGNWRIFIQSTSINRKLPQDSYVLVMK